MALLKPPIMRLPRLRPLVLRRSIWSLRRASSQGIGPPPESTQSTPSCLMRRHLVFEASFVPGDRATAGEHPVDAELFDAARRVRGRIARGAGLRNTGSAVGD